MYKENLELEKPDNPDAIIWRYTNFTKFLSLLVYKKLWFSRLDKLGDPFEGSFPEVNVDLRRENFGKLYPNTDIKYLSDFYKLFVTPA